MVQQILFNWRFNWRFNWQLKLIDTGATDPNTNKLTHLNILGFGKSVTRNVRERFTDRHLAWKCHPLSKKETSNQIKASLSLSSLLWRPTQLYLKGRGGAKKNWGTLSRGFGLRSFRPEISAWGVFVGRRFRPEEFLSAGDFDLGSLLSALLCSALCC